MLSEFNVTREFDITGAGEVWYARPQLFFKCTLCPTGAMENTRRHKGFSLVFFNTFDSGFEPISLTPDSCMQQQGVPMLYELSSTVLPSLYVCPVENVLVCATDPVLLEWEHQQYHPIQVQRRYTSGGGGGFKTR